MQRGQDADHAVGGGADVDDGGAGAHRSTGGPGHEGEPAHHLRQLVQGRTVGVGPGQEALDRHVHEARVRRRERVPPEAEPVERAGGEVVQAHVGRLHQRQERGLALGRLEVERGRALVAVEIIIARARARHAPRLVAAVRVLHLDHVGAEIGQDQRRRRPGDDVAELQHLEAGEGEGGAFGHGWSLRLRLYRVKDCVPSARWVSLRFISSVLEKSEFCITAGYLFRHAQNHHYPHLRLPRNRPWPRRASHRNPCPPPAAGCPETGKAPAIATPW